MKGTLTLFPADSAKYPWAVERLSENETILREITSDVKPEIDLNPIFDKAEELLSFLPCPFSYGEMEESEGYNTALMYGKVQSGKTMSSIALSSLAMDNGYKNIIVLTSNVNLLQFQTEEDFKKFLPAAIPFDEPRRKDTRIIRRQLKSLSDDKCALFVIKKNSTSLENLCYLFSQGVGSDRGNLATLIIDDEGDQASLKTNSGRRSIYNLIQKFRELLRIEALVTLTATPFANLLIDPEKDDHLYPTIIQILEPGSGYTGAMVFFRERVEEIIRSVTYHEKKRLERADDVSDLPDGFVKSVLYHLLVAAYRRMFEIDGKHTMLINTEREITEHEKMRTHLGKLLTDIYEALENNKKDYEYYLSLLSENLTDLESVVGKVNFGSLQKEILKSIENHDIQVVNSKSMRNVEYCSNYGSTFLIGQTKLGRGLRIRGLVTTFFLYDPKTANMDTYSQACRFFGYRKRILDFVRIFCNNDTVKRWQHILIQEEWTDRRFEKMGRVRVDGKIGLIVRDRPIFFTQSGLVASRKTSNQISFQESPLDDFEYFQQSPTKYENYPEWIEKQVLKIAKFLKLGHGSNDVIKIQKEIELQDASGIVKSFKSSDDDVLWQEEFISDVLEHVYSKEPYTVDHAVLQLGSNPMDETDFKEMDYQKNGCLPPPVDVKEARYIRNASQDMYPVIYLRRIKVDNKIVWVPFVYLPPLAHGFKAG